VEGGAALHHGLEDAPTAEELEGGPQVHATPAGTRAGGEGDLLNLGSALLPASPYLRVCRRCRDDERRGEGGIEERTGGGHPPGGVDQNAERLRRSKPFSELEIPVGQRREVGQGGAGADDDGAGLGPQAVGVGPGFGAGDPLGRAVCGGRAAVDGRRRLEQAQGTAGAAVVEVGGERPGSGLGADAHFDGDPGGTEDFDSPAGDLVVGVENGDDHPAHAGLDERRGARRRAALVGAGFERDIDGGAPGPVAGLAEGVDLGVRLAGPVVKASADRQPVRRDDEAADPGVRGGGEPAALPQRHRLGHGRLVAQQAAPSSTRSR
jgi:hypothetical protein